jgi:hypothetical protein
MNLVEFSVYSILCYLMAEHLFQTQYMMLTKLENTLDGYWNCLQHSLIHVIITVFFIYIFTNEMITYDMMSVIGILHFSLDKFQINTRYVTFVKKMWTPLTLKLFKDAAAANIPMDKITEFYNKEWQNDLKLDENTFLGTIYYVFEVQMVTFLLNITPIILYWKYMEGV